MVCFVAVIYLFILKHMKRLLIKMHKRSSIVLGNAAGDATIASSIFNNVLLNFFSPTINTKSILGSGAGKREISLFLFL